MKRCAPGAVTAATEGGTGGREGMGASKNEEEATCQEQLLCSCSFAFVFPFYDFVVFIYVSFYICLLSVCLFSKKERKGSHGWQEPPLPRPTPNTPKKTPCCVAPRTQISPLVSQRLRDLFGSKEAQLAGGYLDI